MTLSSCRATDDVLVHFQGAHAWDDRPGLTMGPMTPPCHSRMVWLIASILAASLPTRTPPIRSLCPPRCLEAVCMTKWMSRSIGFWKSGVQNVLSIMVDTMLFGEVCDAPEISDREDERRRTFQQDQVVAGQDVFLDLHPGESHDITDCHVHFWDAVVVEKSFDGTVCVLVADDMAAGFETSKSVLLSPPYRRQTSGPYRRVRRFSVRRSGPWDC